MYCEVLRPFQATNEALLETGQIVDTAGWREESVLRLINQRYLRQTFALQSVPTLEAIPDAFPGPELASSPESEEEPGTTGEPVPMLPEPELDATPGTVVAAKPATVMDAFGRFPKSHRDKR